MSWYVDFATNIKRVGSMPPTCVRAPELAVTDGDVDKYMISPERLACQIEGRSRCTSHKARICTDVHAIFSLNLRRSCLI